MNEQLQGPLGYYGGKKRIAGTLLEHFPKKAQTYVEPFFGGGGMFFRVPRDLYPLQVGNDLNKSVVTFYRVLRDRTEDLVRVCELTPYALEEQRLCRSHIGDVGLDELEVARRVWVRGRQNFMGSQSETAGWQRPGQSGSQLCRTESQLCKLHSYAERLRQVHMDCSDATEVIEHYAGPDTFFYEDPPYHPESRSTVADYNHEMTTEQHQALRAANEKATEAGALIMVSGYGGPFYDELYKGWRRFEFEKHNNTATSDGKLTTSTEVLWMNYPASMELGKNWSPPAKANNKQEQALLQALRKKGKVR